MIKNIIFDLGNVVLEFNPMSFLQRDISEDNITLELYENIFRSKEWIDLDRGTITEEEAIEVMFRRIPHRKEQVIYCMKNWHMMLKPIDGTIEILRKVKLKGYKAYLLSNFHLGAYRRVKEMYDFFNYFDGGVVSAEVKLIKPGNEIYNELSNKYNLLPDESLFIDDMTENVNAAKELGFNTIQFISSEDLKDQLRIYDIFVE